MQMDGISLLMPLGPLWESASGEGLKRARLQSLPLKDHSVYLLEYLVGLAHDWLFSDFQVKMNEMVSLGGHHIHIPSFMLGSVIGVFLLGIGAVSEKTLASEKTWQSLNAEGVKAYQQGRYAQALQWFSQALSEVEKGAASDPRKAATLSNVAAAHEELGNFEEAKLYYQQSLTIVESIQGPYHPDLIPGLKNLAVLHDRHGEFAQAERFYRRSLSIVEHALGEGHPHLIPGLLDLARVSQAQEENGRAEEYFVRALKIGESELPAAHHQTQSIRMQYAKLLRYLNRLDEADALERQARRALDAPSNH